MARAPRFTPASIFSEELRELDISAAELARQIDVPGNRVTGSSNALRSQSIEQEPSRQPRITRCKRV